MNKLTEQLANYLLEDERFTNFKLRKSDSTIINKQSTGYEKVELQNWIDTSYSTGKSELVIHPVYLKRFHVLHKWFEKFSFKAISDQRDAYTIGFDGLMLGKKNEYHFSTTDDVSVDWESFRTDVVTNATYVFNKFNSLEDLYNYLVSPVIAGEKELPNIGADWVFEYLYLTRIVDEKNYGRVKQLILNRIDEMNGRGEPNIERYYKDISKILEYLENEVPT